MFRLSPPVPGVPFTPYASWVTRFAVSPWSLGGALSPPLSFLSSLTALRPGLLMFARLLMSKPSKLHSMRPVAKSAAFSIQPPLISFINWSQFPLSASSYVIGYASLLPGFSGLPPLTLCVFPTLFGAPPALHTFFLSLLCIHLGLFQRTLPSLLCLSRFLLKRHGPIPVLLVLLCLPLYPPNFVLLFLILLLLN